MGEGNPPKKKISFIWWLPPLMEQQQDKQFGSNFRLLDPLVLPWGGNVSKSFCLSICQFGCQLPSSFLVLFLHYIVIHSHTIPSTCDYSCQENFFPSKFYWVRGKLRIFNVLSIKCIFYPIFIHHLVEYLKDWSKTQYLFLNYSFIFIYIHLQSKNLLTFNTKCKNCILLTQFDVLNNRVDICKI